MTSQNQSPFQTQHPLGDRSISTLALSRLALGLTTVCVVLSGDSVSANPNSSLNSNSNAILLPARSNDQPVASYYGFLAQTPTAQRPQNLQADSQADNSPTTTPALDPLTPETSRSEPSSSYGDAGSDRFYVQGAAATTFNNEFGLLGAGLSHFFVDGHSVNLELNGMAFSQTGEDAVGLNLGLIMRWHFLRQQNWSLYVDGGAGLLGTTSDVPTTGSSFNFTPQAGGGATIRLNDQERLMVGLRWHHISNAEIYDGNPGRDSIMGYVGVDLPR